MKFDWKSLSARERSFVSAGLAAAALFVVIQFMLVPLLNWRDEMARKRESSVDLYELVSYASAAAGARGPKAQADLSVPIRNAVTQSADAAGVVLNFVNQRPDKGIDVNAVADPTAMFAWLEALDDRFGVVVESADLAREAGDTGQVRGQLTLVRRISS